VDAGTGLHSPISYALQRRILLHWENPTYRYWAPVAASLQRGMVLKYSVVLFTASHGNTFVRGKCTLPSTLLVLHEFVVVVMLLQVFEIYNAYFVKFD